MDAVTITCLGHRWIEAQACSVADDIGYVVDAFGIRGVRSVSSDNARFESLIGAARAGNGAAFTRLYDSLVGPVAGFVRARGVPDADAVVNEVFLAVFTGLDRFRGDQVGFRAWVFRIARNKIADSFRHNARHQVRMGAALVEARRPTTDDREADQVVADLDVQRLLVTLTPDQRDVVLLRVIADLTVPQTAEVLEKPVSAVKALQRRAMIRLRGEISASGSIEIDASRR